MPQAASAADALLGVRIVDSPGAAVIQLLLDGPPPNVSVRTESDAERLVVNLPGVANRSGRRVFEVGGERVARVRIVPDRRGVVVVVEAGSGGDPFAKRGLVPIERGLAIILGTVDVELAAQGSLPIPRDGLSYRVQRFVVRYARSHPEAPPIADVLRVPIELGRTPFGYVAPREGMATETIRLADVPGDPYQRFYSSAIREINRSIVREFNARGLKSVLVLPDERDVDRESGRDLRPPDQTELRMRVWLGQLLDSGTVASGERIPKDEARNSPAHLAIKQRSPIQPGDLFRESELEDYLAHLNRHAGRNVSFSVGRADAEGGAYYLDYLVAESRPYYAYFQASNTGTNQTSRWRERFGFSHFQLTGHDDILKLDYVTGNFDDVNAVFGSYDTPLGRWDRLRWRIGGAWSQYDASEFGVVRVNFDGDLAAANTQLLANVWQRGNLFVDVYGGLAYQDIEARSDPVGFVDSRKEGRAKFFMPEAGLIAERTTQELTFHASVNGSVNVAGVTDTRSSELDELGRNEVTELNFWILRWDAFASIYLEPLIVPDAYLDRSTPRSSTRAHELYLGFKGQYSPDRLTPQLQRVAGGLYSVRGYPEATAAGDSALIGRAEYRLHIPRLLPIEPEPRKIPGIGNFRLAPGQVFGQPDWDLIVRAFIDGARLQQSRRGTILFSPDETLLGAGLGLELQIFGLQYTRSLTVSFDWGRALHNARVGTANQVLTGNNRFHFFITLVL